MSIQFPDPAQHLAEARTAVMHRVHRHRRLGTVAVAGGVLVAAGVGIGASSVVHQLWVDPVAAGVVCYAHDDTGSLSGTVVESVPSSGRIAPESAAQACASVWRSGLAQAAANGGHWPRNVDPYTSTLPVPRLAFCRLDDGRPAGFPVEPPSRTAAQVCARLGLSALR